MFNKLTPINPKAHQNTKVKKVEDYSFASSYNLASVMIHEFIRSTTNFPIVFFENPKTKEFRPVVLLGVTQGENLFVQNGKWTAPYIPAIIRRYPFALMPVEGQKDKFSMCIDEGSELVNETEGRPLFEENGTPAELFNEIKKYLGELQKMDAFTEKFCQYFKNKELFAPLNMTYKDEAGQSKKLSGFSIIHEDKLNKLPDEEFLEIRKSNFLAPIYAHLTSLGQIEKLSQIKQSL